MTPNKLERIAEILEDKIDEGFEELPKIAINTEEFTICFNNLLSSIELVSKIKYTPSQPRVNVVTDEN